MRKFKFKPNLMDLLILLVIVAAVVALLYIFVWSETSVSLNGDSGAQHKLTYVVEVTELEEEYADRISVGQTVVDSSKKMVIGTVTAVESHPYMYMGTNREEGTLALTPQDDAITLYVTVEADAVMNGYAFAVNGYDIYVGKQIYMSLPGFVCQGFCIALDDAQ